MRQGVLIKTLSKGQITIPAKFRKELGIRPNSYLHAYKQDDGIVLEPVDIKRLNTEKYIRMYSDAEIKEFLQLDKLESKTLRKAKQLLSQ